MDIRVFSLVIFAAFTHALWNFFSKKGSGNLQVMIIGLWMANLILLPASLYLFYKNGLSLQAFKYMINTAIVHVFYYYFLNRSYRTGDISTVYPVSRGTGVAGTAVAAYFFLGETFSGTGKAGISLIFAGVVFLGISRMSGRANLKTLFYSVCVGLMIILYSINDKNGVTHTNPVLYITFKDIMSISVMTPFVFRGGIPEMKKVFKKYYADAFIIGAGAKASYIMILFALTFERAGYVSAAREFSIVFGSIMGVIFLGEKLTVKKSLGIALVTAGLVFIKIS